MVSSMTVQRRFAYGGPVVTGQMTPGNPSLHYLAPLCEPKRNPKSSTRTACSWQLQDYSRLL